MANPTNTTQVPYGLLANLGGVFQQTAQLPPTIDTHTEGGYTFPNSGTTSILNGLVIGNVIALNPTTVIANYNTTGNAFNVILCNASSPITVTLATQAKGRFYYIKNLTTNTVTVSPSAGNIENVASLSLAQYNGVAVMADGTNYWILSNV